MRYFFLFAHPEPEKSFSRALLNAGVESLESAGHDVEISDLYAMSFNPIASERDFLKRRFPQRLQYDREQKFAVEHDCLSEDIKLELDKVFWSDVFIVHFPLYWFSMPAIMKGWFDRVFVNSVVYGAGKRFQTGGLKGRRAMACVSTGGHESMFQPDGLLGDVNAALWHLQLGTLFYAGFEVVPPFMAWSPVFGGEDGCRQYLETYPSRLLSIRQLEPIPFHPTTDFDEAFKMKSGVAPQAPGYFRKE
jgi:NAD(P)H dehydrogenase (quinone)